MITLIAAMSLNRVIGNNNQLPWDIPEDMAFFRETTKGKTVIMGRKTFDSMGRALPKRRNLVITRDQGWKKDNVEVFHSLKEAVNACNSMDENFIIGGAEIYKQALPFADKIYLTIIDLTIEGDAKFPELDFENHFKIVNENQRISEKNKIPFKILTIEKK